MIVTYNSDKYILGCLESLKKAGVRAKIVVVDNGSIDGTTEQIQNLKFEIQNDNLKFEIIRNKTNLGFGKACNIGIKYALKNSATHVLLLNPDTAVEKNFFRPLVENGADIVGPVGGRVNFLLGRPKHTTGRADFISEACMFISGACIFVKREVFRKIGLFDERFFLYFEDVDFCLRAKKAGFSISIEPRAHVIHRTLVGTQKPLVVNLYLLKSNFIFISRWVLLAARPFAYFYWLLLSSKILIEYLLKWILNRS